MYSSGLFSKLEFHLELFAHREAEARTSSRAVASPGQLP